MAHEDGAMKRLLILAMLAAPAAHAAYRCKDETGITHFGDTPPAACANVTMYEVSRSGTVLRTIEPTPTPEQLKARREEAARKVEADKAAAEQRRKDLALLATYSSEKDIDTSRDLNLQPIEGRIKSAQDRIVAVDKRRKELDAEMEFYKAGKSKGTGKTREAPAQLVADVERVKNERATLERSIKEYEKEMQEVRERYEADKKRWHELKTLKAEGKLDLRDPKEIETAKKGAADPSKPAPRKYKLYLVPTN
jgi:chromosome segregation ATPase